MSDKVLSTPLINCNLFTYDELSLKQKKYTGISREHTGLKHKI